MKLIIIKTNLKNGLATVERAVGEASSLPILKNVHIEAHQNKISLTATNLEIATTARISGKVIEEGALTLPIMIFLDIINNLQSERINIETKENAAMIAADNYTATIQGSSAEEFPIIPKIKNKEEYIEMKGIMLREALAQVVASTQLSAVRTELNTVLCEYTLDALRLVGTDSFRLSEKTIPKNQLTGTQKDAFKILLPLKTAQELLRIVKDEDEIKIHKDENQILFSSPNFELISRLNTGSFPDYHAILPQKFNAEIALDRRELASALKLVGVMSSKTNEIKIKITENKKAIEVFSVDQSLGENTYTLPAKIQGSVLELSFNWRYLTDGLRALPGNDVSWGMNENNKPALLRSPTDTSYFYILMPILKA